MELSKYLGPNSYISIKNKLFESIQNCEADTIRGKELVGNLQKTLNESAIPMMEIKAFETNAESISKEDATISDILKLIKKENASGDFNYLINLCKEEHLLNEKRNGVPSPQQTLSNVEHLFNEPSNIVIDAISKNLFGNLSSDLYNDIKTDLTNAPSINPQTGLNKSKNKLRKLNENTFIGNQNLQKFNPVAIKYVEPNKNIYLTQFSALTVDVEDNTQIWKPTEVELPQSYQSLATALQNVDYDYERDEFKLNSDLWDFDMKLSPEGIPQIIEGDDVIDVAVSDLQGLFIESINLQELDTLNANNIDLMKQEADRFVALANNYNKLIKLDEISIVKNDNYFIVLNDVDSKKPQLVTAKNTSEVSFGSFNQMVSQLNESFSANVSPIFESQLQEEVDLIAEREIVKQQLNQNQQTLNELIQSTEKIVQLAEDDSPAKQKATEELQELNESLKQNFNDIRDINTKPLY